MSDSLRDRLAESITDAIETILDQHEFTTQSGQCSCGLRNNMDGDVLDLHRISLIGEAVRNTLATRNPAPHRRKPVTLGQSPPTVCICGHSVDDHAGWYGLCHQCLCPIFETDHDR